MQDHNSDTLLYKLFEKEFKQQLNKIKSQKNQVDPFVLNARVLLALTDVA